MRVVVVLVILAMQPISRERLCVTNGEITTTASGRLAINTPSSRAIVRGASTPDTVEMRFTYLGPSTESKPLASGEIRRQIGLKLIRQFGRKRARPGHV